MTYRCWGACLKWYGKTLGNRCTVRDLRLFEWWGMGWFPWPLTQTMDLLMFYQEYWKMYHTGVYLPRQLTSGRWFMIHDSWFRVRSMFTTYLYLCWSHSMQYSYGTSSPHLQTVDVSIQWMLIRCDMVRWSEISGASRFTRTPWW